MTQAKVSIFPLGLPMGKLMRLFSPQRRRRKCTVPGGAELDPGSNRDDPVDIPLMARMRVVASSPVGKSKRPGSTATTDACKPSPLLVSLFVGAVPHPTKAVANKMNEIYRLKGGNLMDLFSE